MAAPDGSGSAGNPIKTVVEVIARALVDHPDSVRVTESERRGMTVLSLSTAPGDMGKIIGRQGRTVRALRALAHAVSLKKRHRFVLEIVE